MFQLQLCKHFCSNKLFYILIAIYVINNCQKAATSPHITGAGRSRSGRAPWQSESERQRA